MRLALFNPEPPFFPFGNICSFLLFIMVGLVLISLLCKLYLIKKEIKIMTIEFKAILSERDRDSYYVIKMNSFEKKRGLKNVVLKEILKIWYLRIYDKKLYLFDNKIEYLKDIINNYFLQYDFYLKTIFTISVIVGLISIINMIDFLRYQIIKYQYINLIINLFIVSIVIVFIIWARIVLKYMNERIQFEIATTESYLISHLEK